MLDSLRDAYGLDDGRRSGLRRRRGTDSRTTEGDFRADAKVLDGVELIGAGTVADRLWARPAVTVLGIDCPPVVGATPSVQARARALVSLRVPPGATPTRRAEALTAHLEADTPWGARVEVEQRGQGQPFRADTSEPGVRRDGRGDADGVRRARRWRSPGRAARSRCATPWPPLYPQAEILLIGLSEPEAQIHAVNESVSPQELEPPLARRGALPAPLRGRTGAPDAGSDARRSCGGHEAAAGHRPATARAARAPARPPPG